MQKSMKTTNWVIAILAVCTVALAGCKKSEKQTAAGPRTQYLGVQVDWPKLDAEFASATPELQASAAEIKRDFRYSLFPEAMVALDKLSNAPNLTESQKKLLTDLMEQTRQVIAKMGTPPG
jgi:outer membrane murein-binding lipoprotein Lpp